MAPSEPGASPPPTWTLFFGQSAAYAAGAALLKVGNFILLPIYWRHLQPADFGVLAVTELVSLGLLGVLTLCLEGALTRFYHEWPEADRRRHLGSLWLASMVGSIVLAAAAYGIAALAWERVILNVPFEPYVQLAIASALARSFSTIPFALLRIQERLAGFTLTSVALFVITSGISLYLVIGKGMGILGILIGTAAGHAIVAVLWMVFMARQVTLCFDVQRLRPALAYSLPLVPASAAAWIATLCDRFFLDRFAPLAQIGLYSTAGRFSGLVKEGNQALKNAWIPMANKTLLKREDGRSVISSLATKYIAAVAFGGLGVALLAREFLMIFDRGAFQGAYDYVPLLVLAAATDPLGMLAGLGLSMARKSKTMLVLTLIDCALAVTLIGGLTWRFGPMGAAWGLVASSALSVALRLCVSGRAYPMAYEYGKMFGLLALAGAIYWASRLVTLDSPGFSGVFKSLLLAMFALAAWLAVFRRPDASLSSQQGG
jgi:O-antigen/teichoic acid export membrane protein